MSSLKYMQIETLSHQQKDPEGDIHDTDMPKLADHSDVFPPVIPDWIGKSSLSPEYQQYALRGLQQLPYILRYTELTGMPLAGMPLPREFIGYITAGQDPSEFLLPDDGNIPNTSTSDQLHNWQVLLIGQKSKDPHTMERIFAEHMYALSLYYFQRNQYGREVLPLPERSVHDAYTAHIAELQEHESTDIARKYIPSNDRKSAVIALRDVRKFVDTYGSDAAVLSDVLSRKPEFRERDMHQATRRMVITLVNGAQNWTDALMVLGENTPERLLRRIRMQLQYFHAGDSRYLVHAVKVGLYNTREITQDQAQQRVIFQRSVRQVSESAMFDHPDAIRQHTGTVVHQPLKQGFIVSPDVVDQEQRIRVEVEALPVQSRSLDQIRIFLACLDADDNISVAELEQILRGQHRVVIQAREYMEVLNIMHEGNARAVQRVLVNRLKPYFPDVNIEHEILPQLLDFARQLGIPVETLG